MLAPCSSCRRLARDSGACPFCGGALEAPMPRPPRGRYARNAMLVAVATATLACGGTTVGTKDGGADSGTESDGSVNDSSTADTGTGFDATPIIDAFIPDDSGGVPLYGGTPSP